MSVHGAPSEEEQDIDEMCMENAIHLGNLHCVFELESGGTFVYWHTNEHLHGAMLRRHGLSSSLIA